MGIRGELFTTQIPVENRTYFFNVKRYICDIMKERNSREKDVFLCLAPSRRAFAGLKRPALVRSCNGECGKAWAEKVAI